jgi:DNA-directed RNA polymerase subunit H (RpoH/RPB5)
MSDSDFNRYINVVDFANNWRKYKINNTVLNEEAFRKSMHSDQYVRLDCNNVKKNIDVYIYLFDQESKYTKSSQDMKKILKKHKKECNLIFITYKILNIYHKRAITAEKHLKVDIYRHEIFDLVIPKAPNSAEHRIMTRDEVLHLMNKDLCCYIVNLPKILESDPQCIWIGAEIGDVLEIRMLSDITGETYQYRVVIPEGGKVISFRDDSKKEDNKEEDADSKEEDVDSKDDYGKEDDINKEEDIKEEDIKEEDE